MKTQDKCLEILNSMPRIRESRFEDDNDLEYLSKYVLECLINSNYKTNGDDDFAILFPDDTLIMYDSKSCLMYFYDDLRTLIDSFASCYMEETIEETIEKYKSEFM